MTQQDIINTNKDTKILVDEFNKVNRSSKSIGAQDPI